MSDDTNVNTAPLDTPEGEAIQPGESVEQPAVDTSQSQETAADQPTAAEASQVEVQPQAAETVPFEQAVVKEAQQVAAEVPQAEAAAVEAQQTAAETPQAEAAVAGAQQFQQPAAEATQFDAQPQGDTAANAWEGTQGAQPTYVPQTPVPQQQQQQPVGETTPLVLGILSIIFAGIIGLVLSIIGMSKSKQVLAVMPESGKAKGGRICSIIGLVLSIIAVVVTIFLFTVLGVGATLFGGEVAAVNSTADKTLTALTKPNAEDQSEVAEYFAQAFNSNSPVTLEALGINKTEISEWLFADASYKITDTSINNEGDVAIATVTADVSTRSFANLSDTLSTMLNDPTVISKLNSATGTDAYAVLGQVIKDSMAATPSSTKTITFKLTKENGKWVVSDKEIEQLAYQIYAS